MDKTKEIQKFVDDLSLGIFGRANSKCVQAQICVSCGEFAKKFRDEASQREFQISGLCQSCQDQVFDYFPMDGLPDWNRTVTDPLAYKAWVCHFLGFGYDSDDWDAWQWFLSQESVMLNYMKAGLNPQECAEILDSQLKDELEKAEFVNECSDDCS